MLSLLQPGKSSVNKMTEWLTSVVRSLRPRRSALQVPIWLTLSVASRRDAARPTLPLYNTAYIILPGKSYHGRYFTAACFCARVNCHWLTVSVTDARVQSKQSIMALADAAAVGGRPIARRIDGQMSRVSRPHLGGWNWENMKKLDTWHPAKCRRR